MTGNQSFLTLVLNASIVVQLVMLLLLAASVASWAIILRKRRVLRKAAEGSDAFETTFWSGGDLTSIYKDVTRAGAAPTEMAGLFEAGFREFRRLTQQPGLGGEQVLEGCRRAMRVAQMREMDRLEQNLATLARSARPAPTSGCSAQCGAS